MELSRNVLWVIAHAELSLASPCRGVVVFEDDASFWLDGTLPEAIAEVNRYNIRQMVIGDPSLERLRIGGAFSSNNVEGFLRILPRLGVRSEIHNGKIVLTSEHLTRQH